MNARTRSLATMTTLCLLVVAGAVVGWGALTAPLPEVEKPPVCVEVPVSKGTQVFTDQVVVHVSNASRQNGLASRTMNDLVERGFVSSGTSNAPDAAVKQVQIWSETGGDPAIQLVRAQFRNSRVVKKPGLGPGVTVVLGENFGSLRPARQAPTSVTVKKDARICSPPATDD